MSDTSTLDDGRSVQHDRTAAELSEVGHSAAQHDRDQVYGDLVEQARREAG